MMKSFCLLLLVCTGYANEVRAERWKVVEDVTLKTHPDSIIVFSSSISIPSTHLRAALLYDFSGVSGKRLTFSQLRINETVTVPAWLKEQPRDPWLAFDKVQHATFGFLWTLGSQYILVNKISWSEAQALPASIGTSALVGLSKEFYDWKVGPTHYFSKRDLAADALGIAVATFLILI